MFFLGKGSRITNSKDFESNRKKSSYKGLESSKNSEDTKTNVSGSSFNKRKHREREREVRRYNNLGELGKSLKEALRVSETFTFFLLFKFINCITIFSGMCFGT